MDPPKWLGKTVFQETMVISYCHSWGQMSSPMFAQSQLPTAGKRRGAETPGGQASEATADPYDPSGHMKPQKHGL